MVFWKRTLPMIFCFVTGFSIAVMSYIPHPTSLAALTEANDWLVITAGFAGLLGLGSVIYIHTQHVSRQTAGWGYSLVLFFGLIGTVITGVLSEGKAATDPLTGALPSFGWVYNFAMYPLQGTMFAILAFFCASVAFRSFRAKNLESGLLLAAAVLLLLGRVPLGELLWEHTLGAQGINIGASVGNVVDWLMSHINLAAQRGIKIGVTIGVVATSLKIIFGIERSYLGGSD
ncbi:hypothetical protein JYT83_01460 [bacterium AH-315-F18]|nr:hypothetical protein [bacterium AH-315-F18]